MQTSKLNDRLQLLASVGVLAGLLLVAYEVRRNNTLAEAESIRSMMEGWDRVFIAQFETDISKLITKSREEPENLTTAEVERLDGWLSAVSNQYLVTFEMSLGNSHSLIQRPDSSAPGSISSTSAGGSGSVSGGLSGPSRTAVTSSLLIG